MASRSTVTYRSAGAALLRSSTSDEHWDLPEDLDLFDHDASARRGLQWLSTMWQREEIRTAIEVASPALTGQIDDLVAGGSPDARTVRRAVLAVASYLLRWQHRATPFGLFAGIGWAEIGAGAKVRWGSEHRVAVRADAGWLGDVVARLHRCPPLRERLSLVVNDAGHVRGDRFVAPGRAPAGTAHGLAPVEVSVRHSRPVRAALDAAREPVTFGQLRDLLSGRFPAAAAPQIDGMLASLLGQGIMISNLEAPMTCVDALGHTCAALRAVDAHTVAEVRDLVDELATIHAHLSTPNPPAAMRPGAVARMRAVSETAATTGATPLVVDTILDSDVEIPEQVAQEAGRAVGVLLRLSPYPFGSPGWRDYHARFRARYGTGALVPVSDLVADSGLGFPADYLGSAWGRAARQVSERDEKLLALIQRVTVDGSGEIVLTDAVIDDLTAGDRSELVHLPGRVEMAVEIRSASVAELGRGRFTLVVTGTPRPASSMAGRHAHLLAPEGRDRIAATFRATEPDALAAQLSFTPRKQRNDNVTRTGQLLPHVIPVAEHHLTDTSDGAGEKVIRLADLAVTADESRFFLIQISTRRHVEPRVAHALEAGVHTPPLARFLAEITTARSAVYKSFHFGAAAGLPYLPRVRYRNTILSSARWILTTAELPGRGATTAEWDAAMDAWRGRWRLPDRVAVVEHDRRQALNLDHRFHRQLLRARLDRAGRIELRETTDPEDLAWLGRAHEVLIPLVRDAPATAQHPITGSRSVVSRDSGDLPGNSTIIYAQIHGHPERFDELLTEHLPDLISALGDHNPRWWFRRHREMRRPEVDQYLAVHLSLPDPSDHGAAARQVAEWSDALRRARLVSHLVFATHHPQPGRYGHSRALDRVYDVFAADSAAALAQITLAASAGVQPQALAAAGLVDLAVNFIGSEPAGMDWLTHQLARDRGRLDPELRAQALHLADQLVAGPSGLRDSRSRTACPPGGNSVAAAWAARAGALGAYRDELAEQRDPLSVLPSLLHLHHLRAVGVDPAAERVTGRLARTYALRHLARREDLAHRKDAM